MTGGVDGNAVAPSEGQERFNGVFTTRERSRSLGMNERWSERLSKSSASVRSMALVLTT